MAQVVPNSVVISQTPQTNEEVLNTVKLKRIKRTMRALGYTEMVIGLVCCVLGICLLSIAYTSYYTTSRYNYRYYYWNTGEGLWCGIWILIAGSFGIACGRKTLSATLLRCHLAFQILGAIFSAVLFSMAIPFSLIYRFPFGVGVEATFAALSFITLILCIISASYTCCATPLVTGVTGCCGTGCCVGCCDDCQSAPPAGQQVVYVMANQPINQAQPVQVQNYPVAMQTMPAGAAAVPAGVTVQPVAGNPTFYPQNVASQQHFPDPAASNRAQSPAVAKQQEAMQSQRSENSSPPPSYSG